VINLFHVSGLQKDNEIVDIVIENNNIRVEHVAMLSKVSPSGFWYDIADAEWGIVIQGSIKFEYFETRGEYEIYEKGSSFYIEGHQKHRIANTSSDCIVLCVFVKSQGR
jgi:uncharacterized protein YaiE (UPF0345 family)